MLFSRAPAAGGPSETGHLAWPSGAVSAALLSSNDELGALEQAVPCQSEHPEGYAGLFAAVALRSHPRSISGQGGLRDAEGDVPRHK